MPPFLLPLLEALAPLLRKRDTYYLAAIAVLTVLLLSARGRLKSDELALAARPKVETKIEQQVKTVRVAGPVRVETRTVYQPGTDRVVYVDRIVDSAPVTTTIDKESQVDKTVAPACPAAATAPWRYVGVMVDPAESSKLVGLRGGVTLWKRLDLGAGARFAPRTEGQLEAALRF